MPTEQEAVNPERCATTAYLTNPSTPRTALIPGVIGWSYGSLNLSQPNTRMSIQSVAITTNVATLAVTILEGPIPITGNLVTVTGIQTVTSGGGSNFNLTNASLTGVTIDKITGIGTITFALTSNNIATTTDAGMAVVPPAVVLQTLPSTATAGLQFAISPGTNASNNQRGVTWFTSFAGSPTTVTMNLQGSDIDQDAYYTNIDSSSVTAGESRSLSNVNYSFLRVQAASTGGSSPTCAAGIMVV